MRNFVLYSCNRLFRVMLFGRIAAHVALRYALRLPPLQYLTFLRRAALLLHVFRHNKPVRTATGWKLQLYLPAYPSPAFFMTLENKLLRTPPAPASVVFSMTRACGCKCPHCYQKTERGADLPVDVLKHVFMDIKATGVTFFNIEGGEPFLRFDRLVSLLEDAGPTVEVWVNTTGNGVTHENLRILKDKGMAGIMVSLHAVDPAVHDAFTGVAGSFCAACEALRLATDIGLATAVNSVLSEQDLRSNGLETLMDLARSLGAGYVQLIHPKPCGGWIEETAGMQTDPELLAHIETEHIRYNSPAMAQYPSLAAQAFEEREQGVGCTAGGIERFYVTATGEVQPCEFLQLSFGNVGVETFDTIFARMRAAYPVPKTGWLCCKQGGAIGAFMRERTLSTTPLPYELTREFLATRNPEEAGVPTPLYESLGIYKP